MINIKGVLTISDISYSMLISLHVPSTLADELVSTFNITNIKPIVITPEPELSQPISKSTCIVYISRDPTDFFLNTIYNTRKTYKYPMFYLQDRCCYTSLNPLNLNSIPYKNILLWSDRIYIRKTSLPKDYNPIIKDSTQQVLGPLLVSTDLFLRHYDKIKEYDDIAYGYYTIVRPPLNSPNVFIYNSKICCSKRAEMYSKDIIYVADEGKSFILEDRHMLLKIKGEKYFEKAAVFK